MPQPMTPLSVLHEGKCTDVALPHGTTAAGLLSLLDLSDDASRRSLTTSHGTPVPLHSVLGVDVPPGSLIIVTSHVAEAADAAREARRRSTVQGVLGPLRLVGIGVLPLALCILLYALPVLGVVAPVAHFLRIGIACIVEGVLLTIILCRPHQAPATLLLPVVSGCTAVCALPIEQSFPVLAFHTFVTTAAGAALLLWWKTRRTDTSLMASLWLGTLVLSTASGYFALPSLAFAPLISVVAVWGMATAATYAVDIPDSQLIDIPLVMTLAPSVRTPVAQSPAAVTLPRVNRSLRTSFSAHAALTLWWSFWSSASFIAALPLCDPSTINGRAALAVTAASAVAIGALSRQQSHLFSAVALRIPPVVGVVIIAIALAPRLTSPLIPLALCVIAAGVVLIPLLDARAGASPRRSRMADILQSLSLLCLPVAAVFASGAFDYIRQVAS